MMGDTVMTFTDGWPVNEGVDRTRPNSEVELRDDCTTAVYRQESNWDVYATIEEWEDADGTRRVVLGRMLRTEFHG